MQSIAQHHGLSISALQRMKTGSAIVYACDESILKLFCPYWPEEYAREELGLDYFSAHLSVPVPKIVGRGQVEDWPYLIMQRLPGQAMGPIFGQLQANEQRSLMQQLGTLMAEMLALSQTRPLDKVFKAEKLKQIQQPWPEFVAQRLSTFALQQAREGLDDVWIKPLDAFLKQQASQLPGPEPLPLLHCDLTEDHLMVEQRQGQWQITGLIDFGDAMCTHPLYDFGAPLVFYAHGRPDLRRALLQAYGFVESELNPELERRLWTALLLHRFADIPYFLHLAEADWAHGNIKALQAYYCSL